MQAGLIPQLRRDAPAHRASRRCSRARSRSRSSRPRFSRVRRRPSRAVAHPAAALPKPDCSKRATELLDDDDSRAAARRRPVRGAVHPRRSRRGRRASSPPSCARAPGSPASRVHVLVTMRADFYDRPLADPRLGPLFAENVVNVVPLGPRRARGGRDAARPPARRHGRAASRRPADRRRRRPAERPAALPVRADRAVRRADRAGARPRDVRADRRRPQGRGPPRRIDLHPPRRTRAGGRAAAVPAHRHGLGRGRRPPAGSGVGARRARRRHRRPAGRDRRVRPLPPARPRSRPDDRRPDGRGRPRGAARRVASAARLDRGEPRRSHDARAARRRRSTSGRQPDAIPATSSSGARLADYESWASTTSHAAHRRPRRAFLDDVDRACARPKGCREARERGAATQRLRRRTRWQLVALFTSVALLAGIIAYPIVTTHDPRRAAIAIALDGRRGPRAASTSSWHAGSSTPPRSTGSRPWSSNRPYSNTRPRPSADVAGGRRPRLRHDV